MLQCLVEENLDGRLGGEVTVDARIIVHFGGVGGSVGAEVVGKEMKSRGGGTREDNPASDIAPGAPSLVLSWAEVKMRGCGRRGNHEVEPGARQVGGGGG